MRSYSIEDKLKAELKKVYKKDKNAYAAIKSKMDEVASSWDVEHYKNMRAPLQAFKRVHVMKSFLLLFKYDKASDTVKFCKFEHHDAICK